MSKTVPSSLLAHYALGTTTVAHAIFIEREDGETFGFTEHDIADDVDGFTYEPGFTADEIVIASGCDVGNMQMTALDARELFTTADILEHRWRNARFLVFRYNHRADPITDIDECLAGTFGEIEMRDNTLVIEMHDLRRYLNQPVGAARSKMCRYRVGSTTLRNGGLCMLDISGSPFTVTFTVTSVTGTGKVTFRASALNGVHAADWFGDGYVEFTGGDLAGISKKVYSYAADGTFTLYLPAALAVHVGDTGNAIVGCRGRFEEDCVTKLDNADNFGGEPHSRSVDTLTRPASSEQ